MAYPFPSKTLGDFLESIKADYGVSEKRSERTLLGPRGEVPVVWLEREFGGRTHQVPMPEMDGDETLGPDMMDYLCRRLGLSASDFGYTLGNKPWYADD
jgi:hypothetical protein